jgi:hypothetical protein
LIIGATTLTYARTVLPPEAKQQIAVALQGDIGAVSDSQVRTALQGQPPAIVDEVVRINATARDRARGFALVAIALVGVIGLVTSLLLPPNALDVPPGGAGPDGPG